MIRVLVVNCVPERARFEVETLRAMLDIEVVGMVFDGRQARDEVLRVQPDLLVTCVALPSMDGFQMIRELRERAFNGAILVATSGAATEAEAVESGADGFILLPASSEEWLSEVARVRHTT